MVEERPRDKVAVSPKYKVSQSQKFGRYLQAAKNLSPGETILREKPVAVGPMTSSKDYLCFACLRLLPKIKKGAQYLCSRCNVAPLCGIVCEEQFKHHTLEECEIFRNNKKLLGKSTTDITSVLLPLRLWLLRRRDSDTWQKIEAMESHVDKRRNTAVWKDRELNTINVIKDLKLIPDDETSTSEFLQRLCGILDVNTFELRSPGGLDGLLLRGLYLEASLMAHDCRGNTHLTVDDNFQLTVYASLPIKENEPILFNYTSSLLLLKLKKRKKKKTVGVYGGEGFNPLRTTDASMRSEEKSDYSSLAPVYTGTSSRREHLREGKYFECECSLCKDPYEMESHLSSILCPKCREGFLGMKNPLALNPYERGYKWQCNKCMQTIGGRLVRAALNITRSLIDDTDDSDVKALEALVKKLSRSLHQSHFLMLSLKQKLMTTYRKEVASPNPQRKIIKKMLEMCKEMYNVLEIVEPGISRLKGIMLYEMHLPSVLLANRAYAAREISAAELASRLEEAARLLKKSLTMLLLEPAETPEGKLAKRALQELKALNQNVADVKTITATENTEKNKRKSQKIKVNANE